MESVTNKPSRREGKGFTLVEMMVVITVIIILVTVIVGVARYLREEANKRQTEAVAKLLMNAIQNYYDVCSSYPYDSATNGNANSGVALLRFLKGEYYPTAPDTPEVKRKLRPRLADLPSASLAPGDTVVRDAWGTPFVYELRTFGGLAGQPRLRSAGPDMNISTAEDNIELPRG